MRSEMLAKILRSIATAVEGLDESQLEVFVANLKQRTIFANRAERNRKSTKNSHSKVDPIELENVLQQLSGFSLREEGMQLLDRLNLNRKQLEGLARLRSVHVTKDDNVSKIKEKLVEVIIGARLSSRAIRGR